MIPQTTLASFARILEAVEKMFPGSHPVIGGGALRDAYHDRPIKDIDVLIRAQDFDDLSHAAAKSLIPPGISEYAGRSDLHGVWDIPEQIEGYQVQLILADFDTYVDLAGTFDLGICRITFDGTNLYTHPDFLADSEAKRFRIIRMDDPKEVERSERRIRRLSLKYPEFSGHPDEACDRTTPCG